jgi:gliding-associated putative ABC transporter substrate-binding component GldG
MRSRKTQQLLQALLVLGILVLANVISVRLFTRFDLTAENVYTLADASKAIVGSLDDRVSVRAFFTEELPAPYNNNRRATLDILNEYKAYSNGNLQFDFIDPTGEEGEQEAQQQGIAPVQVQVVNNDKLEVKRGYLGLVLLYEDRKETIPVVQNLGSLEYDLSSALKRLTTTRKKKIGYSTGHQEPEPSVYQQAANMVTAQYELVPVDLSGGTPVPPEIEALLVISPQTRFADSSKYAIDQYLMRGGRIAFLLNKYSGNLQSRFAQAVETGLDDMLGQYGIRVNADLVRDAQCAPVTVMQQQGMFRFQSQVPFPLIPTASNFNRDHIVVKDLETVLFFFVSSVDTSLAGAKNIRANVLVRSSQQSGKQTGFIVIDPFRRLTPADLQEQHLPLAAVFEGAFTSFFADKEPKAALTAGAESRILVVGDGDFMKDDYLGSRDNVVFFANIVDYLADDAGLITIRSKNLAQPPLEPVEDGTKRLLKYANLFLPSLLVIGYGLFRWRRRVSLKRMLEAQI